MRIRPAQINSISNRYLRLLYPAIRNLPQAAQELKWLRAELPTAKCLAHACWLRGHSYPLQYILGSQPFGDFEVLCRPNVLIPRWETEEWTMQLAHHVEGVRSIELCTGTGCIAFALERAGANPVHAVDISTHSQRVFAANKRRLHSNAQFHLHDIFTPLGLEGDLLVANPPYVTSQSSLDVSVRMYEPRLALMGDTEILDACLAQALSTNCRAAVIEVGSSQQIAHLVGQFNHHGWAAEGRTDGAGQPRTVWAHKGDSFL